MQTNRCIQGNVTALCNQLTAIDQRTLADGICADHHGERREVRLEFV